ncbi:hypothetical protein TNCV_185201 [Trichonephila clavipes]|nr:hypothetical protein TNCV_185201 [Trichonephila clavipes]
MVSVHVSTKPFLNVRLPTMLKGKHSEDSQIYYKFTSIAAMTAKRPTSADAQEIHQQPKRLYLEREYAVTPSLTNCKQKKERENIP